MRKLSLFIIAAGAALGVAVAQADETIDAVEAPTSTEAVPEVAVDPTVGTEEPMLYTAEVPDETGSGGEEPVVVAEPPSDDVTTDTSDMSVTSDDGSVAAESGTPDDAGAADDTAASDDTGSSDESGDVKTDEVPQVMYSTSSGTDPRPEGCMECRTLTGVADGGAAEAQAPEVMADVLDGNATGVDVMDPADAKKRK